MKYMGYWLFLFNCICIFSYLHEACGTYLSLQKKHLWRKSSFTRNWRNQGKATSDDKDTSLSLIVTDWQEKMLDGEVCLLKDSPFRILRVSQFWFLIEKDLRIDICLSRIQHINAVSVVQYFFKMCILF